MPSHRRKGYTHSRIAQGIKPSDIFNYDTVVFVEGDDDVKIFKSLLKQLAKTTETVGFVDSEGWNNMAYYANAKILKSQRLKINVFAVFDGDTEADGFGKRSY